MKDVCAIQDKETLVDSVVYPRRLMGDIIVLRHHMDLTVNDIMVTIDSINKPTKHRKSSELSPFDQMKMNIVKDLLWPMRQMLQMEKRKVTISENMLLKQSIRPVVTKQKIPESIPEILKQVSQEFPTSLKDGNQMQGFTAYEVFANNVLQNGNNVYLQTVLDTVATKTKTGVLTKTMLTDVLMCIRRNIALLAQMIYQEYKVLIDTNKVPLITTKKTSLDAFVTSYEEHGLMNLTEYQSITLLTLQTIVKLNLEYQLQTILLLNPVEQTNVFDLLYDSKPNYATNKDQNDLNADFDYIVTSNKTAYLMSKVISTSEGVSFKKFISGKTWKNKPKRDIFGIGNFLAYEFGLTTDTDTNKIKTKINDLKVHEHDMEKVQQTNGKKFDIVKKTVQDMEQSIEDLYTGQSKTLLELHDTYKVFVKQSYYTQTTMSHLLVIQKLLKRVFEYQTQMQQIGILNNDLKEKMTAYITNAIPEGIIHMNINDQTFYDVQNTKQMLKIHKTGFMIVYSIPTYTESFTLYQLNSIPFYIYNGMVKFDLMPQIGITTTNKYIANKDIQMHCKPGPKCICDPNIPIRNDDICEISMFNNTHGINQQLCNDKLVPAEDHTQQYIIDKDIIYLSVPKTDTAMVKCTGKQTKTINLKVGINTITVPKQCTLTTSVLKYKNRKTGQHNIGKVLNLNKQIQDSLEHLENQTFSNNLFVNISELQLPFLNDNKSSKSLYIKKLAKDVQMLNDLDDLKSNIVIPHIGQGTTDDIIKATNLSGGIIVCILITWGLMYTCCSPVRSCTNTVIIWSCKQCHKNCKKTCRSSSMAYIQLRHITRNNEDNAELPMIIHQNRHLHSTNMVELTEELRQLRLEDNIPSPERPGTPATEL